MVRQPLTAEQIAAGQRLGAALRAARGGRSLVEVALAAGISPETLRKIEAGRLPAPAFGTVVCLSQALDVPLADLAEIWMADMPIGQSSWRPAAQVLR
ncbi:helix-turn-helix transcriptional regulator [Micromonospora sp. NPDC047527]|uniref:helix-turn-helix domain-containing protein n=1 Tax=unclassified Micromonospora TaxID=2617518 RepID=UPI0033D9F343